MQNGSPFWFQSSVLVGLLHVPYGARQYNKRMKFSIGNKTNLPPSSSSSVTPTVIIPSELLLTSTAAADESLPFALEVSNSIPVRFEQQQGENAATPTATAVTTTRSAIGKNGVKNEEEKEEEEEEKMVYAEVLTDYAMYTDYYAVVSERKEEDVTTAENSTTKPIPSSSLQRINARQDEIVLASLLSGNIRGEPQLQQSNTDEKDQLMTATFSATTLTNSTSSVLQQCQYAAQQAHLASTYLASASAADGTHNVSLAVQSLYSSSNHYKAAAAASAVSTSGSSQSSHSSSGYTPVATSLALLSKYHWKRAEAIRLATSHQHPKQPTTPASQPDQQPQDTRKTPSQRSTGPITHTMPPSATVVRIRDALHANPPEEDISASVFLGNRQSSKFDSTATKTREVTTTTTATTTDTIQDSSSTTNISSIQNPVDDMLQLEKELHSMNMALSMHASVANLQAAAAASSTPTKSYIANNNTNTNLLLSQLRYAAASGNASTSCSSTNSLDSSCWWGQSSFLHPRSDMASSISSWATTTNTLCNIPISTTPNYKPTLMNPAQPAQHHNATTAMNTGNATPTGTDSDVLVHHKCQRDPDNAIVIGETDSSTNIYSSNNNNNAKQVLRLLDALKVLGDENASLLEQVEEAKQARLEAKAAKEEMKRFQSEYQKRFHTLKVALEKLHQQQQQLHAAEDKANFIVSSEVLSSKAIENAAVNQARQQVQSLQLQLQKLQQENKKKEATLKKYENFYKEVKARSAQRAAQRSASTSSPSSSDVAK